MNKIYLKKVQLYPDCNNDFWYEAFSFKNGEMLKSTALTGKSAVLNLKKLIEKDMD